MWGEEEGGEVGGTRGGGRVKMWDMSSNTMLTVMLLGRLSLAAIFPTSLKALVSALSADPICIISHHMHVFHLGGGVTSLPLLFSILESLSLELLIQVWM